MSETQKLAKALQSIAYADKQTHGICWSLAIIHPQTDFNGEMGYSGGIWHDRNRPHKKRKHDISISFSFSESIGIHQFKLWRSGAEIVPSFVYTKGDIDGRIKFDDFVELAIKEFDIDELWIAKAEATENE